jgi:hypothetical protein
MRIFAEALWLPKSGSTDSEYEDAYWPRHPIEGVTHARFAVADGATETSFSGIWAKQLVRAYCDGAFDNLDETEPLCALQRKWWRIVRRKPLPWYAEQKLESGTFAALVGITLCYESVASECGTWRAAAIGDSCLVHLRGGKVLSSFPLTTSSAFTNAPTLLSTNLSESNSPLEALVTTYGEWQSGDHFYLMTDAIAAWFFRAIEQQELPWTVIRDLDYDPKKPFRAWVESARKLNLMRNDDVTLYRIEIT